MNSSVWRPLFGPLEDFPLTYCDRNTVNIERDYLAADLIFPHYIGEQYVVKHHPDHRWYFLSNQTPNKFTLLKCYDNKENVASCKLSRLSSLLSNHEVHDRCRSYVILRPERISNGSTP